MDSLAGENKKRVVEEQSEKGRSRICRGIREQIDYVLCVFVFAVLVLGVLVCFAGRCEGYLRREREEKE